MLLALFLPFGCGHYPTRPAKQQSKLPSLNGEVELLQSWQGDFPVAQFDLLPKDLHHNSVGFIGDAETFGNIWKAFKPGTTVPGIDFKAALVIFARNTQFYNRIAIGKVNVKDGVADVLAMETRSALPIEDKVAMALVVIPREGVTGIQSDDKIIPVTNTLNY